MKLLIIGGGPAGLSAAINARAEGMDCTLITSKIGGRAEQSHAIENYFGFNSISGRELAERGMEQANKFGVNIVHSTVEKFACHGSHRLVQMAYGHTETGDAVVVATGMRYKHIDIPGTSLWGVFYHAEPSEMEKWRGKSVVVVGGENSASQAALNLADHGAMVTLLVPDTHLHMSAYLQPVLLNHPNIDIRIGKPSLIEGEKGKCHTLHIDKDGEMKVDGVVLFGGAYPETEWLRGLVRLNDKGFIQTDDTFMTSMEGVFAIGDVRAGSIKRIGSAVGEGTSVVRHLMKWWDLNRIQEEIEYVSALQS